ncbi:MULTISPECIES: undecaprenyl-diphosphate phosphatase [Acidithiobacillus]|jgi:undecaprenyl-diphosphatase|uniref:Undecaprenyl-diphosphatase n=3 Tax=Acidithiobacillus caldus TaxID=33059 RepID=F9ZMF4_ACICS|nr:MULTISPECIES: undecaprenyl-diphosphate phosphatase [Acidithiobacillus]AEK57303.1 Undecaprenyl-diphosphatase [Acidithiobacillus caldus SM-1]AIA54564.1 Undecaprenyl-diphosphatase [Acidithiobacillus caldus ATCC 51756]AUW32055.1 undecaprenyl-diphosphate phosphatase [Acidithiobacillus caldus]MBU2730498.1 undecaprenyl-diphosphate phosphatase [Acidithiobacillus caldus]MBU2735806.1 undecaprenyl-diphosphate phosphatase [Acidithiobacillus caldus ATCC 51756]
MAHHFYLLILAALQGVTELFPISSLGHSILVPALFRWPIDRDADWFLPFIVVLHLGTVAALLTFFWRDWVRLIGGFLRARGRPSNPESRLLWLLVLASIPAGLLGLALAHKIKALFGGFGFAAVALMLNGMMLIWGDRLRSRNPSHNLDTLSWRRALIIGFAQALALIPGFSRSGATLVAGIGTGLDYENSARFSFLLATPIIAAAGLLEVPKLFHAQLPGGFLQLIFAAGVLSGLFAWLSVWFLMRYFHSHEIKALRPFGFYCVGFGALALILGVGGLAG